MAWIGWCWFSVARILLLVSCRTNLMVGILWHESYDWYSEGCWCYVARILLDSQPVSQPVSQPASMTLTRIFPNIRWRVGVGSFQLGSFAWGHSLENIAWNPSLGSVAWNLSLGNVHLRSVAWYLSFGIFNLETSAWDFRLGSSAWDLAHGINPLGIFRLGNCTWDPALGNFHMGSWLVRMWEAKDGSWGHPWAWTLR